VRILAAAIVSNERQTEIDAMEHYHVQITTNSNPPKTEVKLGLTVDELIKRFVDPYKSGQSILIDGAVVRAGELARIRITKSAETPSQLLKAVQNDRNRNIRGGFIDVVGRSDVRAANKGDDVTDKFIFGPPGTEIQEIPLPTQSRPTQSVNSTVFVVHGRNSLARRAVFEFLRSIGLNPLEWSEAVTATRKTAPYIGEILDAAFSQAQAVVVLMTPDDEARLKEPFRADNEPGHEIELSGQARPNVLFEAGMAMARDEERTILVELGQLRPFSDIAGRFAVRLDDSTQRRQDLAHRLRSAGCTINLDGSDWHTSGDFEAAVISVG